MNEYKEVEQYRCISIMMKTDEQPTTCRIEIRIGTFEGDDFILKCPPIRREFSKIEGILNHMLGMTSEARAAIDTLT